jgi:hypothetical protein
MKAYETPEEHLQRAGIVEVPIAPEAWTASNTNERKPPRFPLIAFDDVLMSTRL